MKELLRKAFEAGKDRQYAIEWQMGRKPDFEEWFKEHEAEVLSISNVSFPLFKNLYGQFVQMNDRFETVHIWSESLALKNKGRWTPTVISEETYLREMQHSWNNGS